MEESTISLPALKEVFDFEYAGGGYFRKKGVPKNTPASILHGDEAIKFLYSKIQNHLGNALIQPSRHLNKT